jgi:hypothetical protein
MVGCRPSDGDNMPDTVNLFEMRRLEALSNTIFGVAMTLLAYNLPKGQLLNGPPDWSTVWAAYQSQIAGKLVGEFAVELWHDKRMVARLEAPPTRAP